MTNHHEGCLCTACVAAAERRFSIFDAADGIPCGITIDDINEHEPVFMAKVVREMTRRATLDAAARNRQTTERPMSELTLPTPTPTFTDVKKPTERSVSKVILAFAHGDGVVLLCEESSALDFVQESGSASSIDGFTLRDCGVSIEEKCDVSGIYVGELHVVDGGPETWEMPEIRDYYPEIRNLRPITKDEWTSHLAGEWPEGWNELQQAQG